MSSRGSQLEVEMRDQGPALERRQVAGQASAARAAELFRGAGVQYLVAAARGSSDNAARYAQYLLGSEAQLVVALAGPSLYAQPSTAPGLSGAGVIGISQSGQSPDIVGVLAAARAQGQPTVAITNDEASPLAQQADVTVPLAVGVEQSVAATKTYVGTLHALVQMLEAIHPDADRRRWLAEAPEILSGMVETLLASRARFDRLDAARWITVVGRGLSYAAAHETALKVRELSALPTEAFSPPDLLHGPVAGLGGDGCLWLVTTGAANATEHADLFATLRTRVGSTLVVAQDEALVASADVGIQLPPDVPGWLASMLAVIPAQVAGLRLAELRGVDLDQPHGLNKVTLTL
jgi:glucosamine--fructose-6-phosphate aminotransferase (isomerizing)